MSVAGQLTEIELSPMSFDRVELGARTLIIDPVLTLSPQLDGDEESHQLLTAEDPELNLDVYAATRDDLIDQVKIQLFFLWDEFALEAPEKLTDAARKLQERLQRRMREENAQRSPRG